jgi:hypothetical protein
MGEVAGPPYRIETESIVLRHDIASFRGTDNQFQQTLCLTAQPFSATESLRYDVERIPIGIHRAYWRHSVPVIHKAFGCGYALEKSAG